MRTRLKTRRGLDPSELPPLTSLEACETWTAVIGRAVAVGTLSPSQGGTALRSVAEWRASHEAGRLAQRLTELEKVVKRKERGR
jgi:hypothetical protein